MSLHSSAPADLPIADIHVELALDWSPAQALAAYEWLETVRDRIWLLYGHDIVQRLRDQATPPPAPCASDDDYPPF